MINNIQKIHILKKIRIFHSIKKLNLQMIMK